VTPSPSDAVTAASLTLDLISRPSSNINCHLTAPLRDSRTHEHVESAPADLPCRLEIQETLMDAQNFNTAVEDLIVERADILASAAQAPSPLRG
jgi:hypothetical protein